MSGTPDDARDYRSGHEEAVHGGACVKVRGLDLPLSKKAAAHRLRQLPFCATLTELAPQNQTMLWLNVTTKGYSGATPLREAACHSTRA